MNLEQLRQRAERLRARIRAQQPIEYVCYWGDEPIPDLEPGEEIIIVDWGMNDEPEPDADEA